MPVHPFSFATPLRATLHAPSPRDIPAVLDQYRLLRPLGWGSTGIVYEAEDTALGQLVALKLIPRENLEPSPRIQREIELGAQIRHRHLVSLCGAGTYAGGIYLVTELVKGGCLQSCLGDGPLHWREATAIVSAACEGLMALHGRGITHGGIKPANLLRERDRTVKLGDFGVARWIGRAKPPWQRSVGAAHYVSPEQCRSAEADVRSDIYSLGATYYSLLTGRTPYPDDAPAGLMFDHCSAPAPDPRRVNAETPRACARIVRRAMAKRPADRYESAREMRTALQVALARDSWRQRGRRALLVGLGVVALLAEPAAGAGVIGGGIILAGLFGRSRPRRN